MDPPGNRLRVMRRDVLRPAVYEGFRCGKFSEGLDFWACIGGLLVACLLDGTLDGKEDAVRMCMEAAATRGGDPGRPLVGSMVSRHGGMRRLPAMVRGISGKDFLEVLC